MAAQTDERRIPSLRHHKATNQDFCELSGQRIYCGVHGRPSTLERYRQEISEWTARGYTRKVKAAVDLSVIELLAAFLAHAEQEYRHADGSPTGELQNFVDAVRPLKALYGLTAAIEFGPKRLQAVRVEMIAAGLCRNVVNRRVDRVRQVFRWAVGEELVPPSVYQALTAVAGLRKGKTKARESKPVCPVPDERVDAVLPFLPSPLAAVLKLQRLTGMRSSELLILRTGDIDRSGSVWHYRPTHHKSAHHGITRNIPLGPLAQTVLAPFLKFDPDAFVFCPERSPQTRYERASYRRAIARACERAFHMPPELREPRTKKAKAQDTAEAKSTRRAARRAWCEANVFHPHQLRHSFATNIRATHGVEAAQTLLGHANLSTAELYAEKSLALADRIVAQVG